SRTSTRAPSCRHSERRLVQAAAPCRGPPPRSGRAFALQGDAMHHPPEAVVVVYRIVLRTAVIPERDGVGFPGKAAGEFGLDLMVEQKPQQRRRFFGAHALDAHRM